MVNSEFITRHQNHLSKQDQDVYRGIVELMQDDIMWSKIRRAAKTNPALQSALDQCIVIYTLSKDHTK